VTDLLMFSLRRESTSGESKACATQHPDFREEASGSDRRGPKNARMQCLE
jgi:hypothetical protein